MNTYYLNTNELTEKAKMLKCGDRVFLSGTVYTARDAAHKRIAELIKNGKEPPFELRGAVIYYAGPTPTPPCLKIGSCGPTTSARMDKYTPDLLNMGVAATIGKGERSEEVIKAIKQHHSVYLCAIGGAGALAATHIKRLEVTAFEDLGCESVKKLLFDNFPLTVAIDSSGDSIFFAK